MKETLRKLSKQVFPKKRVIRTFKLHKEASNRDYYRIFLSGKQTCIAMVLTDLENDQDIVNRIYDATYVFETFKIPVPSIYRYFEDENILFVKDIGHESLETFHVKTGKKTYLNCYMKIIDSILKIHNSQTPEKIKDREPFKIQFTKEKFHEELLFFLTHSGLLSNGSEPQVLILKKIFERVAAELITQKYTLTHRDLHSRNIKIKQGHFSVLDHQDARLGPYTYDLVSLVKDSYVDLSWKEEAELIGYFIDKNMDEYKTPLDEDKFFRDYYLCMFQRSLKAAGTFYYQTNVKNHRKFRKYIPTVLKYAQTANHKLAFSNEEKQVVESLLTKLIQKENPA